MTYKILATLAKKYRSLPSDLLQLKSTLNSYPTAGIPLGKDCYKIRLRIQSKGKGKSAGVRVITYVFFARQTVYLLAIYDKSESESITLKELQHIIKLLALEN